MQIIWKHLQPAEWIIALWLEGLPIYMLEGYLVLHGWPKVLKQITSCSFWVHSAKFLMI